MDRQAKSALDKHLTTEPSWRTDEEKDGPRKLFDVACVIGSVYDDPSSPVNAHEAAYLMIARHDMPGTFSWTTPEGYAYSVTVERKDPPQDVEAY